MTIDFWITVYDVELECEAEFSDFADEPYIEELKVYADTHNIVNLLDELVLDKISSKAYDEYRDYYKGREG